MSQYAIQSTDAPTINDTVTVISGSNGSRTPLEPVIAGAPGAGAGGEQYACHVIDLSDAEYGIDDSDWEQVVQLYEDGVAGSTVVSWSAGAGMALLPWTEHYQDRDGADTIRSQVSRGLYFDPAFGMTAADGSALDIQRVSEDEDTDITVVAPSFRYDGEEDCFRCLPDGNYQFVGIDYPNFSYNEDDPTPEQWEQMQRAHALEDENGSLRDEVYEITEHVLNGERDRIDDIDTVSVQYLE